MEDLDELLDAEKRSLKTFHPVHERSQDAWHPGNNAASLVVQCNHIWEDITVLVSLHNRIASEYPKKLILKYALTELRSLVEVFDKLVAIAMNTDVFNPRERQGWREITEQEREDVKRLLKGYSNAKRCTVRMVIDIRNNIGAHRSNVKWQDTMKFWDSLTPELLTPLITSIPPAFNFIKELDLYEWNRSPEPGVVTFLGSRLRPEYFE